MRVDPDNCNDPDLLAAEVRRLRAVIDSGSPTLTDEEREALRKVLRRVREDYFAGRFADSVEIAAVIDGLLERTQENVILTDVHGKPQK